MTPDFVLKLGWAAGQVLAGSSGVVDGAVLIGKDTRVSGYMFESALEAGFSAAGVDVKLLGPMPTPGIAYLTHTYRAAAGVVISASHNPYQDNGIKFFGADGMKLSDETELAIEAKLDEPLVTVANDRLGRAQRIKDAQGRYIEFCKGTFPARLDLRGLNIVVDCANGAAYQIASHVFSELGAQVTAIGVKPDGFNINQGCGSTEPEQLQAAVVKNGADLGIALDGDADRVQLVTAAGDLVDGDQLLYLIAMDRKNRGKEPGVVVGTVMSNLGLEQGLKAQGIGFERAKVGDRYVLEKLRKNGHVLGGESSGHILCLDKTSTGDGIVAALEALTAVVNSGKSLAEIAAGMRVFPQVMINVPFNGAFDVKSPAIRDVMAAAENQLGDRGRVVLRASGTEPLVRVMVEAEDETLAQTCADMLAVQVQALGEATGA